MSHQINGWVSLNKVVLILMALACSHIVQAELLSDDFNAATSETNPVWRFFDPFDTSPGVDPGESKLTYDGTNALIDVPAGQTHDLWKTSAKNKAPRLLQPSQNIDFQFEVKFETAPNVTNQLQGIVIQESDNEFLRFDVFSDNSGIKLFVAYINVDTNTNTTYEYTALPVSPNYRQVIRSGDDWTFRYSDDGVTWNSVSFSNSLTVTEVGFFAGNAGQNPGFLSSVDYFTSLDASLNALIEDDDTWSGTNGADASPPVISTWYDYAQPAAQIGRPGVSQQQANILGNVSSDISLSTLAYTLNDGPEQPLKFGRDTRRLQRKGDFNIEIDHPSLKAGPNTIEVIARDSNDQVSSEVVTIHNDPGNTWPFPYTADWGSLVDIQDVETIAHIVDGLWELTPKGIRTAQTGYDRTIAIGDMTWSSDYQVTVPITFNTTSFRGVGFGIGWQGHVGNRSPRIEWPLQSLVWIRGPIDNATLEIITYGGLPTNTWENVVTPDPQQPVSISRNVTYMLKSSSELLANGTSRFNVKSWPQSEAEPTAWIVSAEIPTRAGSVLLVAHQADVTFGNVIVEALSTGPSDTTPPVISDIKIAVTDSTAVVSWKTDELSTSEVSYGLDSSLGSTVNDIALVATHSLTLTDLVPNSKYNYQIKSTDANNNTASRTLVFNTSAIVAKECSMDVDGNAKTDALTDGLLFIRYLLGIRDESLIENAVAANCTNCSSAEITPVLEQCNIDTASDIDGNDKVDALTDGLLVIRYLFGIRGDALVADSVEEDCTRCTVPEIETYLQGLLFIKD